MIHLQSHGAGAFVAASGVVTFVIVFVSSNFVTAHYHINPPDDYYQFLGGLSFVIAAVILKAIPLELDKLNESEIPSTFMYIPVRFWPHIYTVGGLILMLDAGNNYYKWF